MPINLLDARKGSIFVTKNKERCTVISSDIMPIAYPMPVFKIVFVTSAGVKYQAMYYQNGSMFDTEHKEWDVTSMMIPLKIPENLKRSRSSSEPIFKRHKERK